MFHCHHLTPCTALFSASKSPPQSQILRRSHTYTASRFMEENHGLPLTRQSCLFVFLSQSALQWWPVSNIHRFHICQTPFKTCIPQVAECRHQLLCERHKKKQTVLHFQAQILSKLSGVNITHLCKMVERHRLCLSAPKSSGRGATNKQLWQRKAVLLAIKSIAKLPTISSVAPCIGSQELRVTILLFLCLPVQLSKGKKFPCSFHGVSLIFWLETQENSLCPEPAL